MSDGGKSGMARVRALRLPALAEARRVRRFALVGIASNGFLYLLYLLLTALGMTPKPAMTAVFIIGVLCSFAAHSLVTFRLRSLPARRFWIFSLLYLAGYGLNYLILTLFVDRLHLPHQPVQAGAIILVGMFLYVTQRTWVFPVSASRAEMDQRTPRASSGAQHD